MLTANQDFMQGVPQKCEYLTLGGDTEEQIDESTIRQSNARLSTSKQQSESLHQISLYLLPVKIERTECNAIKHHRAKSRGSKPERLHLLQAVS